MDGEKVTASRVSSAESPRAAVFAMQRRHQEEMESTGFSRVLMMNVANSESTTLDDMMAVQEGSPIVFGVDRPGSRAVYIVYRRLMFDEAENASLRSTVIGIGERTEQGVSLHSGYELEHFELIERLYDEVKELQQTVAPQYNIEQGLIGE